jgi:hypothetical protein
MVRPRLILFGFLPQISKTETMAVIGIVVQDHGVIPVLPATVASACAALSNPY